MNSMAIAVAALLAGGTHEVPVRTDGPTTFTLRSHEGAEVLARVELQAREWPTRDVLGSDPAAERTWGPTVVVVQDLRLTAGRTALAVPRSAFADLLDVRTVEIRGLRAPWVLLVRGGAGPAAYEARVEFDAAGVKSRRTFAPLEPVIPTEETRYPPFPAPAAVPAKR